MGCGYGSRHLSRRYRTRVCTRTRMDWHGCLSTTHQEDGTSSRQKTHWFCMDFLIRDRHAIEVRQASSFYFVCGTICFGQLQISQSVVRGSRVKQNLCLCKRGGSCVDANPCRDASKQHLYQSRCRSTRTNKAPTSKASKAAPRTCHGCTQRGTWRNRGIRTTALRTPLPGKRVPHPRLSARRRSLGKLPLTGPHVLLQNNRRHDAPRAKFHVGTPIMLRGYFSISRSERYQRGQCVR